MLWDVARHVPLLVVAVLAAIAVSGILIVVRQAMRQRQPATLGLLQSTDAGRRALRVAAEDERDQSAQRIHDLLLPRLRAIQMGLEVERANRSGQELQSPTDEIRGAIMTDQLVVLRDAGLSAAIRDVVERVQGGPAGRVEAGEASTSARPPLVVEEAALRIAQEAVNNIVTHASADSFVVRLDVRSRSVLMEIEDDGVGMDPLEPADAAAHLGLRGMEARAKEVGGTVTWDSRPASGTIVRFRWPA